MGVDPEGSGVLVHTRVPHPGVVPDHVDRCLATAPEAGDLFGALAVGAGADHRVARVVVQLELFQSALEFLNLVIDEAMSSNPHFFYMTSFSSEVV